MFIAQCIHCACVLLFMYCFCKMLYCISAANKYSVLCTMYPDLTDCLGGTPTEAQVVLFSDNHYHTHTHPHTHTHTHTPHTHPLTHTYENVLIFIYECRCVCVCVWVCVCVCVCVWWCVWVCVCVCVCVCVWWCVHIRLYSPRMKKIFIVWTINLR